MADITPHPIDAKRTLVLLALAAGGSRAAAAGKAGITDRTLRRWIADEPEFAEAIEVALGAGRSVYEELLREAGKQDWRAALALYDRIYVGKLTPGSPDDLSVTTTTMTVASGVMASPERAEEVLGIMVRILGPDATERVLLDRADRIEQDRAEGSL